MKRQRQNAGGWFDASFHLKRLSHLRKNSDAAVSLTRFIQGHINVNEDGFFRSLAESTRRFL